MEQVQPLCKGQSPIQKGISQGMNSHEAGNLVAFDQIMLGHQLAGIEEKISDFSEEEMKELLSYLGMLHLLPPNIVKGALDLKSPDFVATDGLKNRLLHTIQQLEEATPHDKLEFFQFRQLEKLFSTILDSLKNKTIQTVMVGTTVQRNEIPLFRPIHLFPILGMSENDAEIGCVASSDIQTDHSPGSSTQVKMIRNELANLLNTNELSGKDSFPVQKVNEQPQPVVRLGHLIQDIGEVVSTSYKIQKTNATSQIRLLLSPEHLGHLDIKLTTSMEGKLIAEFAVSNQVAKDSLGLQVHQLRQALVQQGIPVEKIEITHQNTNHNLGLLQDDRSGQHLPNGGHNQEARDQMRRQENNWSINFAEELEILNNINYVV